MSAEAFTENIEQVYLQSFRINIVGVWAAREIVHMDSSLELSLVEAEQV
jgi:hypothetical protein